MIEFKDIEIRFDNKIIIEDFSKSIGKGEHICIMGKSGAGKSSLLTTIIGITPFQKGDIIVNNKKVNPENIYVIRSEITWVPQEINLPYEYVKEAIKAPYQLKVNKYVIFNEERMFDLFKILDLDEKIYDARMSEISGGERQRIMLISGLLLNRKILLLDEPTSALDVTTREHLIELIKIMTDTTIIAVTHDKELAESFDKTITINKR